MPFRFNPFTGNLDYYYDETGVNTGDVTLTTIGSTPNSNGASLVGQQLQLQPADASFGGVVTTTTQSFAGDKTFTGVVAHKLGTSALPAIVPTGDVDTGIWSSGANSWSVSTTGVERLRIGVSNSGYLNFGGNFTATNAGFTINSIASNVVTACLRLANGQSTNQLELYTFAGSAYASWTKDGYILVPSGSGSGSAAYGFFGDSNTGLFSTGADSFSATTGGSERLRFLSGGHINVGANFTDTNATLQVSTFATGTVTQRLKAITSQTADLLQLVNTSNTPLIGATVSGNLYVGSNGIPTANTSHSFTSVSASQATRGLKVRSSGTQTADLISIFNSADAEIAQMTVSGYLQLPLGTSRNPSHSFYNNGQYGMYKENNFTYLVAEQKILGVDKNGDINVTCHNNSTAIGNSSFQEIRSGSTFEPTISNETNITLSILKANWMRVGNVVTCSVFGSASTTTTNFLFEMDLPVPSNFSNDYKAAGTGIIYLADKNTANFIIYAESTNNTIICEGFDSNGGLSDARMSFHFTYEVE